MPDSPRHATLSPTTTLVVSENADTCSLLRLVLKGESGIDVLGEARNGAELSDALWTSPPDVVLVDLENPGAGVSAAIDLSRRLGQGSRYVGLIGERFADVALLGSMDGILPKNSPLESLSAAIRETGADSPGLDTARNLIARPAPNADLSAAADPPPSAALKYSIAVDGFFNARHQVTIDGVEGPLHAHSWRVSLRFRPLGPHEDQSLIGFAEAKRLLNDQIAPFDGQVLNSLPRFAALAPTTENVAAILFSSLKLAAADLNIVLDSVTVWESPTISVTCSEGRP